MPTVDGDIFRVAARMNQSGSGDFVNVYHYRVETVVQAADFYALQDFSDIMDRLYTQIYTAMPDGMTFEDVNVFNVTQNRPLGSLAFPVLTAGSQATDDLPPQCAAFVRGLTGYSRNWARKFIGPLCENQNQPGGLIGTSMISALTNYGANWLDPSLATPVNTYVPVVRYAVGGNWQAITAIVLSNIWATMRRR